MRVISLMCMIVYAWAAASSALQAGPLTEQHSLVRQMLAVSQAGELDVEDERYSVNDVIIDPRSDYLWSGIRLTM